MLTASISGNVTALNVASKAPRSSIRMTKLEAWALKVHPMPSRLINASAGVEIAASDENAAGSRRVHEHGAAACTGDRRQSTVIGKVRIQVAGGGQRRWNANGRGYR